MAAGNADNLKSKSKKIKTKKIVIFLLIFSFIFTPLMFSDANQSRMLKTQAADTVNDLQKKIDTVKAKMKNDTKSRSVLEAEIAQAEKEKRSAYNTKATYDKLIANIQEGINDTEEFIALNEEYMLQTEESIAEKQAEYDKTYEYFLEVLRFSYEDGNVGYIEMILKSEDFVDFLSRMDRIADIVENNKAILKNLQAEKNDLEDRKATLEKVKEENEDYMRALTDRKAELNKERQRVKNAIESYEATIEEKKREQQKIIQDELNAQNEIALLTKALQAARESQKTYIGGVMRWPVDLGHRTISSGYGTRTNPFTKRSEFHYGIDIPATHGSNIYAANDGIVLQVKTSGSSYGQYIVLDHGGGTTTLYAHCSSVLKKVGDKVYKSDTIAKIGSTGASTGPHLHFEVAKNGERLNPLKYVNQP